MTLWAEILVHYGMYACFQNVKHAWVHVCMFMCVLMCFDGIFVWEDSFQHKLLQMLRKTNVERSSDVFNYDLLDCQSWSFGLEFELIVWRDLNSTHCAQWRYSYFVTAFLDLVDGIFFDLSIYRRYRAVTVFSRSDGIKILSSLYPPEKNAVNWRHFQNQKKYCRETWRYFFLMLSCRATRRENFSWVKSVENWRYFWWNVTV